MSRRSRDATLMDCAYAFEVRSTCIRKVGAVIAIDGRILSSGYNGAPVGLPHCDHTCSCGGSRVGDTTGALPHDAMCRMVRPCVLTVHAETNAILFAARHGTRIEGATLYTTVSPCWPCALAIVNAGLIRVVYDVEYRDPQGVNLLREARVELRQLTKE